MYVTPPADAAYWLYLFEQLLIQVHDHYVLPESMRH